MRLLRLFVAALWLAAFGLSAAPARAGTINVALPTWTNRAPDRLINLLNRKDCLDDAVASFNVSFVSQLTGAFEVWSGSGCDQAANRQTTTVIQNCVRVSAQNMAVGNQIVKIHFRDMVAPAGSAGNASIDECNSAQSVGLQTRTLYFVVFDMNTQATLATGTNTAWAFKYDISAPPPPTGVSAQSGDGTLVTSFTPPTGETNLLHYHFYCSPQVVPAPTSSGGSGGTAGTDAIAGTGGTAGTDATAGTAGTDATAGTDTGGTGGTAGTDTGGTAGTDTGGTAGTDTTVGTAGTAGTDGTAGTAGTAPVTVDPNCGSTNLVPGQPPPADAIDCGTVGAQGSNGGETTPVLTDDMGYAVAVATEDTVNNIGVLSGLACATPKAIDGFFASYRQAGGQGGGGYCSFAPAHQGAVATALGFLLGACALLARRRR